MEPKVTEGVGWRAVSAPPDIEPGKMRRVILAVRHDDLGFFVYEGAYCNAFQFQDDFDEQEPSTGFFRDTGPHGDYDETFERVKPSAWMPLPEPPTDGILAALNAAEGGTP